MFNTGGAVEHFEIHKASEAHAGGFNSNKSEKAITASISLRVKGSGRFGVYSSQKPLKCVVDDNETEFNYESESGLTTFYIPVPVEDMYIWPISIHV
jgi:raffinose synthase